MASDHAGMIVTPYTL